MTYLLSSEYELYALDPSTPDALVAASSSLIDAHCRRPTLAVQQYTDRMRIAEGRNSVRLTYLPLASVAPATSPIVSAQARYAMPRRGESAMTLVANPARRNHRSHAHGLLFRLASRLQVRSLLAPYVAQKIG